MQLWSAGIEEKFLIKRCDQNVISFDPSAQTRQGGQGGFAVLIGTGKRFLKGVIARKNGGRSRDLLVALLDQFFENAGAGPEAGFDLSEGVAPIRLAHDKVSRALQQRQERE